ncbi:MAG TPA: class I mannose-6-phosphate isomerase [Bacteroidales bacterium]|nr:class I mannose-6-phosphate isomerase [Bacteroidales bacterium]
MDFRKTSQFLLPEKKPYTIEGDYDIYPAYSIGVDLICTGFESLAKLFSGEKTVIIDGYSGVFYEDFRKKTGSILESLGKKVRWISTEDYLRPPAETDELVAPFLGGDDPLFGKRADLKLEDFFVPGISYIKPDPEADISIVIGPGAALTGWKGLLVYIDIPKNEIQFRSRAGTISNLGAEPASDPKQTYKRFYFVDWPVLNRHKSVLLPKIDIMIDAQRPHQPSWITGDNLRDALGEMSINLFRARPWFEPGTWGGTWIKSNITGLNTEVPNYAWSFELISPENGLLLESSGRLLEVSFDTIMYLHGKSVLGNAFPRFQHEFPIRFDFLDTFDGGNLSIQCHPRPEYTSENFGESFTQEETYYILDAKKDSKVYLGFSEDISPEEFRRELQRSFEESQPVEIERFVQKHDSHRHDLFLIPYGTIHGSGKNNLVLEISSTPYIFTFKMYDWLRPDLDGKPRPLNIKRGMENLYFDRKGKYVAEKLVSKPVLLELGEGWELWHLPTHETHLYDIHRYELTGSVRIKTDNKCHVLSLVEGSSITVETANGVRQVFNYAETFVVPAAAGSYTVTNNSRQKAMFVKAFVK